MEEEITTDQQILLLRNKFYKSFEDFNKDVINLSLSKKLKFIETLDINRNYLNELHFAKILSENIMDNKRLKIINLTANDLTSIPKEISFCINLERLVLNNNKIKRIENIDQLKSLKILELRSNRIEKWENLEKLINLKFLTISTNLIRMIEKLSIHENIEELGLFGNYLGDNEDESKNIIQLTELLKQISLNMPKLKYLFIGGNYFSRLSSKRKVKKDYKELIKEHLSFLKALDGEII